MAEPKGEQVVALVQTTLQAIVGDEGATRWYTPSPKGVIRPRVFSRECLNVHLGDASNPPTIYAIVPADNWRSRPGAFGGVRLNEWALRIVGARRFEPSSEDPFQPPTPERQTIQHRILADVEAALLASDSLNGRASSSVAINVDIRRKDTSPENTYVKGWAVAYMEIVVLFQSTESAP